MNRLQAETAKLVERIGSFFAKKDAKSVKAADEAIDETESTGHR
jgi:hypothetical protein